MKASVCLKKTILPAGFSPHGRSGEKRFVPKAMAAALCIVAAMLVAGCASWHGGSTHQGHSVSGPIDFYRGPLNGLQAVREGSCPMNPTCSAYAKQAFEKHGPFLGWAMTFDRLIRCGHDETKTAGKIYIDNDWRYHDPVDYNDFWWYENGDLQ